MERWCGYGVDVARRRRGCHGHLGACLGGRTRGVMRGECHDRRSWRGACRRPDLRRGPGARLFGPDRGFRPLRIAPQCHPRDEPGCAGHRGGADARTASPGGRWKASRSSSRTTSPPVNARTPPQGSLALADAYAQRDATVVKLLRDAGAVILGKTNLTEFANILAIDMPSGYSSLGGQVKNPYAPQLDRRGAPDHPARRVQLPDRRWRWRPGSRRRRAHRNARVAALACQPGTASSR